MRKYIKNNILKSFKVIDNAIRLLAKLIDKDNQEGIKILLPDMQEQIINIGEILEDNLGENCDYVKILEDVCEDIWSISQSDKENDKRTRCHEQAGICKKMWGKINGIVSAVSNIKEEKVIMLFPYMAAMWDSLYGAYIKANEENNCTVMVVPIPYFEKNKDGTIGNMHYEKDLFDKQLPIYDYDKLEYSKIHPEEVYIHNPYDEFNFVTTVHPFFYCKNIKNFTDKLIYIPYFVHYNDVVKEHFCVLPGTVQADEVWLQSENVRKKYIKYYKEQIPNATDADKFIVVKSSKLNTFSDTQEDIPEEWKKLIFKDGIKLKVIFFNTHLSCLMKQNSEKFFAKIEEIFGLFKNNNNMVLLWRPHPLTLSTIRSMNPEVEKQYLDIIQKFKDEQIGIFDDSPDIHRAINISDAYYGSTSSVVEMFKIREKPIMIMNLNVKSDD